MMPFTRGATCKKKISTDIFVATTGNDSTGNGTENFPYATILKASQVATTGATINVAPGTYEGGFTTSTNGTATARITYKSTVKWGAKIVPPASSSSTDAWWVDGAYIDLDGFEVDGTNHQSGTRWKIGINARQKNVRVINCHVHHIYHDDSLPIESNGGAGILINGFVAGYDSSEALNCVVHHIGFSGNNYVHGIYLQQINGKVKNCIVHNCGRYGIIGYHDIENNEVSNNTVFNCSTGIGMVAGEFYNKDTPVSNLKIHNNISYGNTQEGIYASTDGQTFGTNNTYTTNCAFGNGTNFSVSSGTVSGSIISDPLFVNYRSDGTGDYRLKSNSPCINAGTSTVAPTTDINGSTRPYDSSYDVGAYEWIGGNEIYVATTGNNTTGNGSTDTPYATIIQAASVASPGDTIIVASGDYVGGFTTNISGTSSNRITYRSETSHGARIIHPSSSSTDHGWYNTGSYVTIEGFDIAGNTFNSGTRWRLGIHIHANNCIVKRCFVHNIWDNSSFGAPAGGGAGILMNGQDGHQNCLADSNWVQNIGYSSSNLIHGIYISQRTTHAKNNVVHNIGAYSIHLYHDILNNEVVNNTIFNSTNGIMVGQGGYYVTAGPSGAKIHNNIVYSCTNTGIREYEDNAGSIGNHSYSNNCTNSNGTNTLLVSGSPNSFANHVSADPMFTNYLADGNGSYNLQSGSPCRNAGLSTYAPSTDYAQTARPQSGTVDIGAYES